MADSQFRSLFDAEFDAMVSLARALSHDASEVEDIVMDAFIETNRRLDSIENPGAYLRTAVINGARRRYRNHRNRRRIRERYATSLAPDELEPTGEHYIDDLLSTLSEREHTAIVLIYYLRATYEEAAIEMQCPAGTVKSLTHRALRKLRQEVSA